MSTQGVYRGRRGARWVVAIAWAAALLHGMGGWAQDRPVAIGLLAPSDEPLTLNLRQGAETALAELNAQPGRTVRLVVRQQPNAGASGLEEAARLTLDGGALALLTSPKAGSAAQLLGLSARLALPWVTLNPNTSVTGAGVTWVLQVVPSTAEESRVVFEFFRASTPKRFRWVAFVPSDPFGSEAAADLGRAAVQSGCQLEAVIPVGPRVTDFSPMVKRLASRWPDGILVRLDPEGSGRLVKALRAAGFSGPLAGAGSLWTPGFLDAAGDAADGFVVPMVAGGGEGRRWDEFAARYQARYGTLPDQTAGMAYDGMTLLGRLFRAAGDRPVAELMPPSERESGVTGPLVFRRDGSREVTLTLRAFRDGKLGPLPPATGTVK